MTSNILIKQCIRHYTPDTPEEENLLKTVIFAAVRSGENSPHYVELCRRMSYTVSVWNKKNRGVIVPSVDIFPVLSKYPFMLCENPYIHPND